MSVSSGAMPDEAVVPEFTLPDWGEDGAPPEPAVGDDDIATPPLEPPAGPEIEILVETPVLTTTASLPDRWEISALHGVISAHGKSEKPDLPDAVASATAKAADHLIEEAQRVGANAVMGIRYTTATRKSVVVVTAYGTAVTVTR